MLALFAFGSIGAARGDLVDQLRGLTAGTNQSTLAVTALSRGERADGLKQALSKDMERAVSSLGRDDGFLTNLNVKIPMSEKLHTVEKTLRTLGQEKIADDLLRP